MKLNEQEYRAAWARVAKLKGEYSDGYKTGLKRNQHGERVKVPGVPTHKNCITSGGGLSDEWVRGYKDGFEGNTASPKRGAPKGEGPAKSSRITLRCTEAQKKKYDKLGGNEWLLGQLS